MQIQTLKTAIEVFTQLIDLAVSHSRFRKQAAKVLLRVDDIVQAKRREKEGVVVEFREERKCKNNNLHLHTEHLCVI